MFPKTKDLTARRRALGQSALDRDAWLRDIHDVDQALDDDPINSHA